MFLIRYAELTICDVVHVGGRDHRVPVRGTCPAKRGNDARVYAPRVVHRNAELCSGDGVGACERKALRLREDVRIRLHDLYRIVPVELDYRRAPSLRQSKLRQERDRLERHEVGRDLVDDAVDDRLPHALDVHLGEPLRVLRDNLVCVVTEGVDNLLGGSGTESVDAAVCKECRHCILAGRLNRRCLSDGKLNAVRAVIHDATLDAERLPVLVSDNRTLADELFLTRRDDYLTSGGLVDRLRHVKRGDDEPIVSLIAVRYEHASYKDFLPIMEYRGRLLHRPLEGVAVPVRAITESHARVPSPIHIAYAMYA